jgi:hypothetical protein
MLGYKDARALLERAFGPSAARNTTRFVAIAGQDGLRWIIPARLGAASRVLSNWHPWNAKSRLAWRVIRFSSHSGILSLLPGTHTFEFGLSDVAWQEFGWTQTYPPLVVTYVGTVGPHQKLVCSFVDPHSFETSMVVKFPLAEMAKDQLRRDYNSLCELIDEERDLGPKPLHMDSQARFAAQSFLPGRPEDVPFTDAHLAFQLALVRGGKRLRLDAVRGEVGSQRDALVAKGLLNGAALDWIDKLLNSGDWSGTVPSVRTHGDFAPWNLKRSANGAVHAVDWEDSAPNDLPYIDLHHFRASIKRAFGKTCSVPWDAYTAALRRLDSEFSATAAATAFSATRFAYWARRRASGRAEEWDTL